MGATDPQPTTAEGLLASSEITRSGDSQNTADARNRSSRIARASGVFAIALGLLVLTGWALGIAALANMEPSLGSMKALSAMCLALSGCALLALTTESRTSSRRVVVLCSSLVALIAALTVVEYAFDLDIGIDRLFWRDSLAVPGELAPARMGLNTALAFLALTIALVAKRRVSSAMRWTSDAFATGVFVVSLLPALGYLYRAPTLAGIASFSQMALHTALAFLVLSVGVVAAEPAGPIRSAFTSQGPGGVLLRRMVPLYTAMLLVLGWVRLIGQERGYFGLQAGVAIGMMASLLLFAIATGLTAHKIDQAEVDRTAMQLDLAERELRYRLLIDATFGGVVISQNGIIREANEGYATMFGYEPHELPGKSVFDLLTSDSADKATGRIRSGVDGSYDLVGLRKDGTTFTFETIVRTHGTGPGQLRVAALRDTTVQRDLEAQLRQSQKMDAIGHLAGGVAHDFNNLLTVILSYTLLLLRENHPQRTRDELQQILKAAESASSLTRQLLAFSRQQVLEPKLISINTVVTSARGLLTRLLGEDIAIRTVLSENLHAIKADPGQLEQVVMNLAVNARDAMPNGGKLGIETTNVTLGPEYAAEHQAVAPGDYVQLTVTDSGAGMDKATKVRIFEPFFTTKAVGKGTGLGLASVYGIVQQSGGHIWVYSEPGHGTTFKLYFPASKELMESAATPAWSVPSFRGTETILLAEDATDVRQLTRSVLEALGYHVIDAADPAEAHKASRAYLDRVDLLLTDVVMPGMSGPQLAELLKAERPELKVLFVSGYTSDTVLQRGLLKPGMTMLQKPYTPDSLARKVRDVLDGRALPTMVV